MKHLVFSGLLSYILGCIHPAYLLGRKYRKIDIRENGSGNSGASNAIMVIGWKLGFLTLVFDVFKGYFAVYAAKRFLRTVIAMYVNAFAVIMGHIFPVQMKFRGGKGVAALVGASLGFGFPAFAAVFGALVAVTLITDYIAFGACAAAAAFALRTAVLYGSTVMLWGTLIILFVMILRHRSNFQRIFAGGNGEVTIRYFLKQRGIKPDDLDDVNRFKEYMENKH